MPSIYFQEEHALFRQSVRDFLSQRIRPRLPEWEKAGRLPREVWKELAEMDLLGLYHSKDHGGSGADLFFSLALLEELGRLAYGGFSAAVSVHAYMATHHLAQAGSDFLRQRYLTPAIRGEKIGALAISEPGAGSDVAALTTTARREGDGWVVNGSKIFITNGVYADFLVTAVKTPEGISLLVIDGESKGLTRTPLEKMGWHCSDTAQIGFNSVKVPAENLVGEPGMGFRYIMDSFQLERLAAGAIAIGGMDATLELTQRYLNEREVFGKPLKHMQVIRHTLADLLTELEACRQLAYHTAWLVTQGPYAVTEGSMVKLHASELAHRVADRCLQFFGGYGFMDEYPVSRAFRDSRVGTIVGGASEIMREIIARLTLDEVAYQQAYTAPAPAVPGAAAWVWGLPEKFRADKAGNAAMTAIFDLSGPGGGVFSLEVKNGRCTAAESGHPAPDVTLTMAADDFVALMERRLDPLQAFLQGKMKTNDPVRLQEMMKWFSPKR